MRDTVTVAKDILGKRIIRKIGNNTVSGIITETEAYRHTDDPASHAFRKITDRNKVMFGEVGVAYVYFTYGMHYCFNVVARNSKTAAGAVLIRAIEPEKGIEEITKSYKWSCKASTSPANYKRALWVRFDKKINAIHHRRNKAKKGHGIAKNRNQRGN